MAAQTIAKAAGEKREWKQGTDFMEPNNDWIKGRNVGSQRYLIQDAFGCF